MLSEQELSKEETEFLVENQNKNVLQLTDYLTNYFNGTFTRSSFSNR